MYPGSQTRISHQAFRFLKSANVANRRPDRHSRDNAKTWQLHQAADLFFFSGYPAHEVGQTRLLFFCKLQGLQIAFQGLFSQRAMISAQFRVSRNSANWSPFWREQVMS